MTYSWGMFYTLKFAGKLFFLQSEFDSIQEQETTLSQKYLNTYLPITLHVDRIYSIYVCGYKRWVSLQRVFFTDFQNHG